MNESFNPPVDSINIKINVLKSFRPNFCYTFFEILYSVEIKKEFNTGKSCCKIYLDHQSD